MSPNAQWREHQWSFVRRAAVTATNNSPGMCHSVCGLRQASAEAERLMPASRWQG